MSKRVNTRPLKLIGGSLTLVVVLCFFLWPAQIPRVQEFDGHKKSHVHAIAFHPDGQFVASSEWGRIRIWDASTGQQIRPEITTGYAASTIHFLSPTEMMYSDTHRGVVIVNTTDWQEKQILRDDAHDVSEHAHSIVASCSADGRRVVAYFKRFWKNSKGEWDLESREYCKVHLWRNLDSPQAQELPLGELSDLVCLAFHPKLPHVAGIDTRGRVQSWNLENGEIVMSAHTDNRIRHEPATACTFSPAGDLICTPNSVIRYSTAEVVRLTMPGLKNFDSTSVAVSPDGKWIFIGGIDQNKDSIVRLWDMQTLEFRTEFVAEEDATTKAMSLSRDGRLLAVSCDHPTGWHLGFRLRARGYPVRIWGIRDNLNELVD